MLSPARKTCYRVLLDIELRNRFSDEALNSKEMERLDVRDRHLTTEIVYGTLRWQAFLDHILQAAGFRTWQDVESGAKVLLRMSLYQMWHTERVPHHAIVNDAVELAKRTLGRGIEGYINGVLRTLVRTRPWKVPEFALSVPEWVRVSLPQWLWQRWITRYGQDRTTEYALSLNEPPQAAIRVTLPRWAAEPLPFEVFPSDIVPDAYGQGKSARVPKGAGLRKHDASAFRYQDEASQLIAHLLGSKAKGRKIWDACAAPGGKTEILSKLCGDKGFVVASDLSEERVLRIKEVLRFSGARKPAVLAADARSTAPFSISFDAVLADVPCSGLGTLRRNPEIKWRIQPDKLAALQRTQREILDGVSQSVQPGGWLVYSTCSTEPEENEEVIQSFLDSHPDFRLKRPASPPGIERWTGPDLLVRTFPSARHWDGFFAGILVRRAS